LWALARPPAHMARPMFVPDFPTGLKQKPIEQQPWAIDEALDNLVSTYSAQFQDYTGYKPRTRIVPPMAYDWKGASASKGGPTRSTASESYLPPPYGVKPVASTKPAAVYERAAFTGGEGGYLDANPNTTTASAAYISHAGAKRTQAIYPHSQRPQDDSRFEARSTTDVSYPPHAAIRPRDPIKPKPNGVGLGGGGAGEFQTTSQGAFRAYDVQPYKPAKKPQPTGIFG